MTVYPHAAPRIHTVVCGDESHSLLRPSYTPPLEAGPLNPAKESGERCGKLPRRCLGRNPGRNCICCILALKSDICGNKFKDFPENQTTKSRAEFPHFMQNLETRESVAWPRGQ